LSGPERIPTMTRFFEEHRDVMDRIAAATSMEDCRFFNARQGTEGVIFGLGITMYNVLLLLEHQLAWAQESGDTERAVDSVVAMMAMARHLLHEPNTVDHETAIFAIRAACDGAEGLIASGGLTADQ